MPLRPGKSFHLAILVAIIFLGLALRVYRLEQVPPGMFYDESFNAIQARNVERGVERPVFFVGNGG